MTDEIEASASPTESAAPGDADQKPATGKAKGKAAKANAAPLPFEAELWRASDVLRGNIEPSEYKHIVLGLIFLKYVSESFEHRRRQIGREVADPESPYYLPDEADRAAALEDRDFYLSRNVAWIPADARWQVLQDNAKQADIGSRIDASMDAIEKENPDLRGVLPKVYGRTDIRARLLGELIDTFSNIPIKGPDGTSEDILGRTYEYFLNRFGNNEGGEFYTPQHVVKLLVEMLEPYKGRVYDPCCGSGGMFVQSAKFVEGHGGRKGDIRVFGQEAVPTTWRLAKMNLAVRHIDADLGSDWGDSFHEDKHPDLRADFVIANPPFNQSEWGGQLLKGDPRWTYGDPPPGNANFAWVQVFLHHLAPTGTAGFVLARGALSTLGAEGEIRRRIVEADLVDCIVALPTNLFFGTTIPVALWFLSKNRGGDGHRARSGETLFIDASTLGTMVSSVQRTLSDNDVQRIADTYHRWRSKVSEYADEPGFCRSVAVAEIVAAAAVLNPARYVGASRSADDEVALTRQDVRALATELSADFAEERAVEDEILARLATLLDGE